MRASTLAVVGLFLVPLAAAGVPSTVHFDPLGHAVQYQAASRAYADVDSVVIHTGETDCFSCLVRYLHNPGDGRYVSAHYVADWSGEIVQQVYLRNVAWHATYYNGRSIGIENTGHASHDEWTRDQYHALAHLGAWLATQYDVPLDHPTGDAYDYPNDRFNAPGFVAHSQIQPWNRSDPGANFDWNYFMDLVIAYYWAHEVGGVPAGVLRLAL